MSLWGTRIESIECRSRSNKDLKTSAREHIDGTTAGPIGYVRKDDINSPEGTKKYDSKNQ